MNIRPLHPNELTPALFAAFDRHQVVTHCWRKEEGQWVIRPIAFTEDWGEAEYRSLVECLLHTLQTGGAVFGAFRDGLLKGLVSVENQPLGSRGQYLELSSLHVSADCRRLGLGAALFAQAKRWAKEHGAEKLYLSTHSSVESHAFYVAVGCVEAEEYNPASVEKEPFDVQMECRL